jgi:mono/diheme cytochrome c family protein
MINAKMKVLAVTLALLGLAMLARDAMALSLLERQGRTLSVRLCAQCHAIGRSGASPRIGAPPFRHLEQRLNLDTFGSRLRQGLMTSHHDMPAFRFKREDARAMVAYLRAIQGP